MIKLRIDKYSNFFKISKIHPSLYLVIKETFRELLQVSTVKMYGRFRKVNKKVYAAKSHDDMEYRYHINYYDRFMDFLKAIMINDKEIEIVNHGDYDDVEANLQVRPHYIMRDYQEDSINYILDDGISKLVTLQTGMGKGIVSMKASEIFGKRAAVIVLARYKEKWIQELTEVYDDNLVILDIKKLSHLIHCIQDAIEGRLAHFDVLVMTKDIMMGYIREWEAHGGSQIEGMVSPELIYEKLGIGMKIIDEAHQHFHAVFKMDLYSHVNKAIYLTATLDTNDRFQYRMYEMMWPTPTRLKSLAPKKYDNTIALLYQHTNPDKIRCTGQQGYSHAMYEKSIFKHVPSSVAYLDMIGDVVENYFIPVYEPGKRMLIFCSLVETCGRVVHYLKHRFKDKKWNINRFIAGDSKEIIDTSDITVSTLGKSGTALDVPGLVVTFMTVALSEPKANKQAKGRNRDLSHKPGFEHIVPKFIYLVGSDIDKHWKYHKEKKTLFAAYTLSHEEIDTGYQIGLPIKQYLERGNGKLARYEAWNVKPK